MHLGKRRPDLFLLHISAVSSRRHRFPSITPRKWLVWLYQERQGSSTRVLHAGKESWEAERLRAESWERSSVPLLVPPTDTAAPIHSPLQPDRKARQSKNIRWNFIMVWQYIWLAWHWLKPPTLHILMTLQKAQSDDSAGCTSVAARKRERCETSLPTNIHRPELGWNCFCGHNVLIYLFVSTTSIPVVFLDMRRVHLSTSSHHLQPSSHPS